MSDAPWYSYYFKNKHKIIRILEDFEEKIIKRDSSLISCKDLTMIFFRYIIICHKSLSKCDILLDNSGKWKGNNSMIAILLTSYWIVHKLFDDNARIFAQDLTYYTGTPWKIFVELEKIILIKMNYRPLLPFLGRKNGPSFTGEESIKNP